MGFPFVKRKDYEEVVDKLEALLCEATGGRLSKHTYPLEAMYDAMRAYTQFCCDGAVEEETRELKAEIERLKECPKCLYAFDGEAIEACVQGPCPVEKTMETIKGPKGHNGARGEPGEGGLTAQWLAGVNVEIERLKETANPYKLHYGNLRMEIAREFADRLTATAHFSEDFGEAAVACYDIDNLLEEMTEETNNKGDINNGKFQF